MRINFDFADLEAFIAVCDAGSFKRAADALNLSQSALSRRIQKLEEALGLPLIERTTRTMRLTIAATEFRPRAEALLDSAQEAVLAVGDEANRFDYQRNATVTVAAVPTATRRVLPRAVHAFREQGHRARIRINDLSAGEVTEEVTSGAADFGITFIGGQEPGLEFQVLFDDAFVLVVHRDDPLSGKEKVTWADVDPSRFIAVWKGSGNRMLIDNALARTRQSVPWSTEVRHLTTALGLVEAGLGVTASPGSAVPDMADGALVAIPLTEPEVVRTTGIVRRTGRRLSAPAEAFHQILLSCWS